MREGEVNSVAFVLPLPRSLALVFEVLAFRVAVFSDAFEFVVHIAPLLDRDRSLVCRRHIRPIPATVFHVSDALDRER